MNTLNLIADTYETGGLGINLKKIKSASQNQNLYLSINIFYANIINRN